MQFRRVICQVLILVSLVATSSIMAQETDSENRWEATIQQFEELDKASPPPENAILFVGSSSIVYWRTLAQDMAPLTVINRGFGGSQMFELNMFRDRIVLPYKPEAILVYEGDNDVASGKGPAEILPEYLDFIDYVNHHLPTTDIYLIAVKPSVRRATMWNTMAEVNAQLAEIADDHVNVEYLDIATPMLLDDGAPNPDIFVQDMLHMNAAGYEIWTSVIKPVLTEKYLE